MVHCGSARPGATSANTMRTRVPMPTRCTISGGASVAVRRGEVADDAQGLVLGGLALLRIEVDQQDEIGRVALKAGWMA